MPKAKAKTTKKPRKKTAGKENGEQLERIDELPMADSMVSRSNMTMDRSVLQGQKALYTIISQAQLNETFHKRYIKELKQLYSKVADRSFEILWVLC